MSQLIITEDPEWQVRTVASYALGKTGLTSDRVISALAARLSDYNQDVRYSSARALGNIGTPARTALPVLLDRLAEVEDENVRAAAAETIAKIGPTQDARADLIQALRDDNWFVRHYVGVALKQLGFNALVTSDYVRDLDPSVIDLLTEMGPEAIPELAPVFLNKEADDPTTDDPAFQGIATVALIRMTPDSIPFLEGALQEAYANEDWVVVERTLRTLGYSGKAALPVLIDTLNSTDSRFSDSVVVALARIGPDAIPALVDAVRSGNEGASSNAADALGRIGTATIPYVLPLLGDDDDRVRLLAVQVLGQAGAASINEIAQLSATLDGGDAEDRLAAIATLQEIERHQNEAVNSLVSALQNGTPAIQKAAADSLAQFGPAGRPAAPALVQVLSEGDKDLRIAAERALGIIGTAIIPYVLPLLGSDDDTVSLSAVRLLGLAGSAAANDIAHLAATSDVGNAEDQQAADAKLQEIGRHQNEAVIALVSALQNGTPAIQKAAADSLAQHGPAGRPAASALVEALNLGDEDLRIAAVRALGSLSAIPSEVYAALVTASQDQDATVLRKEAIKALGGMGVVALPDLIQATGISEDDIDLEAIKAIGNLGPAAYPAVSVLSAILKNGRPSARGPAAQSLGEIGPVAVSELLDVLLNEQDEQILDAVGAALVKIGSTAVPGLVGFLESQDAKVVARAVDVLSLIGAPAVPGLMVALRAEDASTRMNILKVLNGIGAPAFAGFEIALQDENEQIRSQAVCVTTQVYSGCGSCWDSSSNPSVVACEPFEKFTEGRGKDLAVEEAIPFLLFALRSGDPRTRSDAADALALIGPNAVDAVPALAEALGDRSTSVRRSAARALGAIGPQAASAAPVLVAALQRETDLETRRSMIEAITATDPLVAGGVPVLVAALHDPGLRRTAAEALGNAGEGVAPALLAAIKEPASKTTSELAEALNGVDDDLRRGAAYALLLNTAATKRISDDLIAVVGDNRENVYVRSMVAAALEHSGKHVEDFWSGQGLESPLDKTCPLGLDFGISGGSSFDIYADGCHYEPAATAPPIAQIFQALVEMLTHR